jgi:hypothetical protein
LPLPLAVGLLGEFGTFGLLMAGFLTSPPFMIACIYYFSERGYGEGKESGYPVAGCWLMRCQDCWSPVLGPLPPGMGCWEDGSGVKLKAKVV